MSSSEWDAHEPDTGDSDTGPIPADPWGPRFSEPLTVTPRQARRRGPDPKMLLKVVAAVGAVAVIAALIFWLTRPSSDPAEPSQVSTPSTTPSATADPGDQARLQHQLPTGYPTESCKPVPPPENVLAQADCGVNTDLGGPVSAAYILVADKTALDAVFRTATAAATRVDCPGNIQSPGPWRHNATPDTVSGQLFCGLREGAPTIVWTDDARMMVSTVRAGAQSPTFPELYAWWASHS